MNEVRKKAKALGIKANRPKKDDLIRMIQRAEGFSDCYGRAGSYCDQEACCFRDDCLTLSD